MTKTSQIEFTTTELLERGWTRTLLKRFLPRPDGCVPVGHWANFRGQDTYSAVKVWNVEQSGTFEEAFLRTWKGRTKGRMKGTSPKAVLEEMRKDPHPELPRLTKEDLRRNTIIMEVAGILAEMRARGFRTPHK